MSNSEARKNFGLAVRHARIHRSPEWSQAQVVQKVNRQFFPGTTTFYQKKLSRIESGDCSLRLKKAEVLALQEIFGLEDAVVTPVLMCLEESPAQDEPQEAAAKPTVVSPQIRLSEAGQLSLNIQSPYSELTGYCGEYHSLFVSTDSNEKRLVEGLFSIGKDPSDPNLCRAHMTLYNEKHEEIKWYSGPFFINRHYRTWHCILIGHEKQEVCMLTASHFNATLRPNQFNMVLALTTSSGVQKKPVVHRLLLSRRPFSKRDQKLIQAQLMLNTDSICISEDALSALEETTNQRLQNAKSRMARSECQAVLTAIDIIRQMGQKRTYYTVNESMIYGADTVAADKRLRALALSTIRACTDTVYYNKVSQTVLEICTSILEKGKKL